MEEILDLLTNSNWPFTWSIFLFGAILGILATWAIWHRKVKGLREEIEQATALATEFEKQATAAEEEIALKESDLKKSALENIKLRQDMKRTSDEFAVVKSEMQVMQEHAEKSKTAGNYYRQQIESLENQVLGLKAKNNALVDDAAKVENSNTNVEVYTLKTKLTKINSELATALVEVKKLEGLNDDLKKDRDALKLQLETKAESAAQELEEIPQLIALETSPITEEEVENANLSEELNVSSLTESTYSESMMQSLGEESEEGSPDEEEETSESIKLIPIVKKPIIIEKPVAETVNVPELAAKKPLKKATMKTPSKKKILSSKNITVKKTLRDDLKKIEGIGPKIEQVLNAAGILNWKTLAKSKTQDLRDILAEAGNRYKMHDPTTWPEQSALAAKGQWDKLKTFQDFLKGGKDISS